MKLLFSRSTRESVMRSFGTQLAKSQVAELISLIKRMINANCNCDLLTELVFCQLYNSGNGNPNAFKRAPGCRKFCTTVVLDGWDSALD